MINFEEELIKLAEKATATTNAADSELSNVVQLFSSQQTKLLKRQNSVNFKLDELQDVLNQQQEMENKAKKEQNQLINAMIEMATTIESFYLFCREHQQDLLAQGELMWKSCTKQLIGVGISPIMDENTQLDPLLNTVVGIDNQPDIPTGTILKVLNCGYAYKGEILKKSTVIVNKLEAK